MKGTLLFLSHDANRTGAPILLKNLVVILRDSGYSINLLVKNPDGPLIEDFRGLVDKFQTIYRKPGNILARVVKRFTNNAEVNDFSSLLVGVNFIINNTITNGEVLRMIKSKTAAKIVTYVHELEVACRSFTTRDRINETIACTDLFLVPCLAVKQFLVTEFSIDKNKIRELNYFIPDISFALHLDELDSNHIFTVGGCGTTDWRKGFDLFIQIASKVIKDDRTRRIRFLWKGVDCGSISHVQAMYDVAKLGLSDAVYFLEASSNISDFFTALDLFVLPSREDPYPLVVLEAAAFKVPTICFSLAGGAGEFVEHDAGTIVNYLAMDEMAEAIINYYDQRVLLKIHGEKAFKKLRSRHQNVALIIAQFEHAMASA